MKGIDIVVGGSIGHMSAFMAQRGCLVVCGDAGDALGDSIYETHVYVRGRVAALGADCVEKELQEHHVAELRALLERSGIDADPSGVPALRLGAAALQLPRRQRRRVLMRESHLFDRTVIAEIQRAAREGIYDIRGFGAKRRLPHFDDLLLLGASISRYPLEGYRERCGTDVVLGTRFAKKPLELKIPITIAGMSFGALSAPAKEALGRAATEVGTSTTTGDGGMTPEERQSSKTLVYQLLPSRYGMNPDDLRAATRSRSSSARERSPAAAACCSATRSPTAWRRCATCRRASTSGAPPATRTGPGRTTSRSRSSSCARSPTGRSRSSSRSARRASTTTCSSRSRRAPT